MHFGRSPFLTCSPLELLLEGLERRYVFGKVLLPRVYLSSIKEIWF